MPTSGPAPKPHPPPLPAAAAVPRSRGARASSAGTSATGRETAPNPYRQVAVAEVVPLAGSAAVAAVMWMRVGRWRRSRAPVAPVAASCLRPTRPGTPAASSTGAPCGIMEVATSLSGAMLHLQALQMLVATQFFSQIHRWLICFAPVVLELA